MDYWNDLFSSGQGNITSSEKALVVSILSVGTFCGALSSPLFADTVGRKWGLFLSCWVFNIGVVFQTAATKLPLFNAGRFFAGAGVGLVSAMIPLYQSETAPKWARGFIVGTYQLAITIGIFLAAIANNACHKINSTASYRIPIAIQFLWSLLLMAGMLVLPETPRYLVKKGNRDSAKRSLARIRRVQPDDPRVEDEIVEIEANHQYELSIGKASYIDCFRGRMFYRQVTGMALQAFQQLTGVNFIFYFGTTYFQTVGIKPAFIIQVITCLVNTLSTFPGIFLVDRIGRRKMLLVGAVGMCISQFIVAMTGMYGSHLGSEWADPEMTKHAPVIDNIHSLRASIAFVCIFIFFFASTWGPLAWIYCGELFPLKFRARSLSITTATNWLWNWAIGYSTPYLVDEGPGNANLQSKIFFIWFGCCFFCIAFTYFFIYETKGLTLEQVDEMFENCMSARKSATWVPTTSYVEKTRQTSVHGPQTPPMNTGDNPLEKNTSVQSGT